MVHNNQEVLEYWNTEEVESMYDKNLLNAEIELIKAHIPPNAMVLDVGCGEGEGTLAYSAIPGTRIHAIDFSETRLRKATERLKSASTVELDRKDMLAEEPLGSRKYDVIVSQRFLINLMEWALQKKVLGRLTAALNPGGRLILLEGSKDGVNRLNGLRALWGLDPIPIKWHNLFLDDKELCAALSEQGLALRHQSGLGAYFVLTRCVRPALSEKLDWDFAFNRIAASSEARQMGIDDAFSRLKLWVFQNS